MLTSFAPGRPAREADAALKAAVAAESAARKCAVLWFGEMRGRGLYRDLGYSSMQQYARVELGFSETRIGDFMRLARKLDQLPEVRAALPEIGYTKAREIVRVASPRTQDKWVATARTSTREELVRKVKRVKARSRQPAAELFAATDEPELAAEVPVRVNIEFTPEQHARWEALWEQLRKRGATGDRAEVLLAALHDAVASASGESNNTKTTPGGMTAPPVQLHIHQCPDCAKTEINGRQLGRADAERAQCDAVIDEPGKRATSTIPPSVRRQILTRDNHCCQAPGCGRRHFLEIHHRKPRARGGTHEPANLITLCAACHRLRHERRSGVSPPSPGSTGPHPVR